MSKFTKLIEEFTPVRYPKVTRSPAGNKIAEDFISQELARYLGMYAAQESMDQKSRLVRDGIDFWLRRYHGFAVNGSIGAHYREVGVNIDDCDFEHVIPQKTIRDMLIAGVLTIEQAMNAPTCYLHRDHHKLLKQSGWDSNTPSALHFFDRYTTVFQAKFETYSGQAITDPHAWDLEKHYKFFKV